MNDMRIRDLHAGIAERPLNTVSNNHIQNGGAVGQCLDSIELRY